MKISGCNCENPSISMAVDCTVYIDADNLNELKANLLGRIHRQTEALTHSGMSIRIFTTCCDAYMTEQEIENWMLANELDIQDICSAIER